jgi:hypothetical protein
MKTNIKKSLKHGIQLGCEQAVETGEPIEKREGATSLTMNYPPLYIPGRQAVSRGSNYASHVADRSLG